MEQQKLQKRLNLLEQKYNSMIHEIKEVDFLLRAIGFPDGIQSIKGVARDILKETKNRKRRKHE